ncbi:MAG: hypothetical protein RL367_2349 [Pseudomonadota bacterium]
MAKLRLNPDLDVARLARDYGKNRRVRVESLLEPKGALALHDFLDGHDQWWQLINTPEGLIELDRGTRAKMSNKRRAALDARVFDGARRGFQYRYEGLRVPDIAQLVDYHIDPLVQFARLMASKPMLGFLRAVTGCTALGFTDGHATAYGPGDFLTGHDDDVAGKGRLAAYVFGLTRVWKPEWGGLLLFHGTGEATVSGLTPRFNTLDLFAVPQRHSVSVVTPSAPFRRYAVTGWLRAA